jgi:pimeloyl-ACP methyl ester carboxylesterase
MLLVSVRKNFTSSTDFSEADAVREIQQPKLKPYTELTIEQLQARVAGKRCLILIHGYRNPAGGAVRAYWKVQEMLRAAGSLGGAGGYDEIIGYLWPGGLTRVGFVVAIQRANRAGKRFEQLLLNLSDAAAVDVQTHSLGARVALEALDRGRARIRGLHLTAPAVDDEAVERGEVYQEACEACGAVYVFHSKNDKVLKVWYRFGQVDRALGWKGPQHKKRILPNTKVVDCQDVVKDHGGYRDAPQYFTYWQGELTGPGSPQFVRLKK